MTTETAEKKTKKAPEAAPEGIEAFNYDFLEATESAANVDPKSLLFPSFDSRADSADAKLEPSFAADIKANGILQPPLVTPVRDKTTGKTGLLIVAGRQRVKAAIAAANDKNKMIPVHIKTMTLREAVVACGVENIKRKSLSFWDEAAYMRMLRDELGFKQTEIKEQLGVADSKVSQYLAVFDLDQRVQKMVKKGLLDPGANTKVRALKAVKDVDLQYGLAVKAAEAGWNSDDIDEAVKRLEAQAAAKERAAKERVAAKKSNTKKSDADATGGEAEASADDGNMFDPKTITPLKRAEFHALLESVGAKIEKMRAKDNVDESKLAYERGKLDGLKLGTGLKALPKSFASSDAD